MAIDRIPSLQSLVGDRPAELPRALPIELPPVGVPGIGDPALNAVVVPGKLFVPKPPEVVGGLDLDNADATATKAANQAKTANATQVAPPAPAGIKPDAFSSLLNNALQPNALSQYYQNTFHFRLFMASDTDILEQAGKPTAANDLIAAIVNQKIKQITIAETGVTGYNIKDVEINTQLSQNALTHEQHGTSIEMTVVEPMGLSFLDAIFGAAAELKIFDYTKTFYYLELTFTGYNEDGSWAKRPLGDKAFSNNGGRWIWQLKPTIVQTKINEGGGVYHLTFVLPESQAVIDEDKKLTQGKQTLTVKGKTVGDVFKAYADEMNKVWTKKYSANGVALLSFKIVTHPVVFGPYTGEDPASFQLRSKTPDESSIKGYEGLGINVPGNGDVTATVPEGMSANQFIASIIKSTEKGQTLIKDEPILGNTSLSGTQTNDRKFREVTLFSVEMDPKVVGTEPNSGNYIQEITLHVKPHYSQTPVIDRVQVKNADEPAVQKQMISNLVTNGMLRKRYDYIFTGKNTEVIDFNIDFKLSWQAVLPKLAGARMTYNNVSVNARINQNNKDIQSGKDAVTQAKPDLQAQKQALQAPSNGPSLDIPAALDTPVGTATAPAGQNASEVLSRLRGSVDQATGSSQQGSATISQDVSNVLNRLRSTSLTGNSADPNQARADAPANAQLAQPDQPRLANAGTTTPETKSNTIYIEDILDRVNDKVQKAEGLPHSFWQGGYDTEAESGKEITTGQFGRDQSVVGAIFAQIYGQSITDAFQSIDPLTIRGDPYWLGQTNLERMVALRNNSKFDKEALPDFSSYKPVLYLYFRYPLQTGADFTPILTNSETFNGLYEVTRVKHLFNDGMFKQQLTANRLTLHDMGKALSEQGSTGGGAGSSAQLAKSGASGGNTQTTPGQGFTLNPTGLPDTTAKPTALQTGDSTTVGGLSADQVASYKAAIGQSESQNRPSVGNNGLGFIGQYQMGRDALVDTGYLVQGVGDGSGNPGANPNTWSWTGKNGINSVADFLNNPTEQNVAMNSFTQANYSSLLSAGSITSSSTPEVIGGLLGAAHIAGAGGTNRLVSTGANPRDANGASAISYYNLGYNGVRLTNKASN